MNDMNLVVVDYARYKPGDFGYTPVAQTPLDIDRKLGTVTYRVNLVTLDQYYRINEDFPWETVPGEVLPHANPIIASVFAKNNPFRVRRTIFAIGSQRSHGNGLMVASIRSGQDFAHDAYLPSWVSGMPDPKCKFESRGFPPGVHFLVCCKIPSM